MQFTIQKDVIYNGLNVVGKAAALRGIQPVLSNVLIETLEDNQIKLCATDLDISIEIKVPAIIVENGNITLPSKKLFEIISKLPNEAVNFNLNKVNNLMEIKCGKSKFDLRGISASEFPVIEYPETEESVSVEINTLLKAVKQTTFATATYDSNNVLSGVLFKIKENILEMAATDGNRLARVKEKIENKEKKDYSVVIPSRTLKEFTGILSGVEDKAVSISVKNSQILFKLNDRYITSRLIEGQYPSYEQLIPKNYEIKAIADKASLNQAIDRAATMVNERTNIVKMNFNDNKLKLTADTPDLGDSCDEIDVEFDAEELNIAFNHKYIQDFLKVVDTEKVLIELNGSLAGTLFKSADESDFLCLVMPVQVN
jgi:DNA polymerase-3 subunit beta